MPRINPVPEKEREIGRRLRAFRQATKLSQVAFAKELGIDSSRLASYEHGRVPFRYELAKILAREFRINFQWLAEGVGEMVLPFTLAPDHLKAIDSNALFSNAYSELKHEIEEEIVFVGGVESPEHLLPSINKVNGSLLLTALGAAVEKQFDIVPQPIHGPYVAALALASAQFKEAHKLIGRGVLRAANEFAVEAQRENLDVDKRKQSTDKTDVRLTWQDLRKRLEKATAAPGMQSAAAKFLGVNRANINRWASGEREPGAEDTFRLLEWVTAEEAKTKSPGSAETPPEQMTRTANQSYEERKQPEPRKRSQKKR